jgi:Ferritin-like domain
MVMAKGGSRRVQHQPTRCGFEVDQAASRADVVTKALVVGGALVGGTAAVTALPSLASSAPSKRQDARVLNFVLLIEELEAAFYAEALARRRLTGELQRYARIVGGHERAHVRFLRGALGGKARKRPEFDFGSATSQEDEFMAAAIKLEDAGVAAYNGQATNLTTAALGAAARIVSVEARHAAWIRDIAGRPPAAEATDPAKSERQIRAELEATGFLK